MFVFENLMDIDDRSIQLILREVQSDSLILALKGASPDLREKIFKNMSQRAAEMLREDLESKGPVRLSEVESEQKEILKIARRLADEGTSYKTLLDDIRRELALSYLRQAQHSISEITYLLGFSDTSSFTHAFRRWTGEAPSRWRETPG